MAFEKDDQEKNSSPSDATPDYEKGAAIDPAAPLSAGGADDNTLAILELVKANDAHHPMHWPTWQRWAIISVYCLLQVFITITSTSYIGVEYLIQEKWGGSTQVVTLGQSLFIVGTAVGPAFMGPLS
jgi:hypothetical protein